jgi:hypothetical protein
MRPNHKKKLHSYIRLLNLFELELKKYHSLFDNNNYQIDYVIKRERYSSDVEIRLTLTILKLKMWRNFAKEPFVLKRILGDYCNYISVSDFTIVRNLQLNIEKNSVKNKISILPLEKRVGFDLFMRESRWYTI